MIDVTVYDDEIVELVEQASEALIKEFEALTDRIGW